MVEDDPASVGAASELSPFVEPHKVSRTAGATESPWLSIGDGRRAAATCRGGIGPGDRAVAVVEDDALTRPAKALSLELVASVDELTGDVQEQGLDAWTGAHRRETRRESQPGDRSLDQAEPATADAPLEVEADVSQTLIPSSPASSSASAGGAGRGACSSRRKLTLRLGAGSAPMPAAAVNPEAAG
jgi:hypothetical protein